jgi:hypothetical protein
VRGTQPKVRGRSISPDAWQPIPFRPLTIGRLTITVAARGCSTWWMRHAVGEDPPSDTLRVTCMLVCGRKTTESPVVCLVWCIDPAVNRLRTGVRVVAAVKACRAKQALLQGRTKRGCPQAAEAGHRTAMVFRRLLVGTHLGPHRMLQ